MRYRSHDHYLKVKAAEALLMAQDLSKWPNWPPDVFEQARVLWEDDERLMGILERIKEDARKRGWKPGSCEHG